MKKNTTFEIILTVILLLLCVYTALKAYNLKQHIEYVTDTVTDTFVMTNVEFDTVFLTHISTDTLAVTDTAFIYDTINNTYYIPVEVPVSSHIIDTNIDTNIHLYEQISGYKVNLDSLALEVKPVIIQPQKKWYNNLGVGVGLMYGTSGFGIGVGLMYKL